LALDKKKNKECNLSAQTKLNNQDADAHEGRGAADGPA
jgi:hypothetical protein